ncbi:nucleoside-diphosphate-sugar epimerase [Colletotrichum graminicola]|uniref:Nucleoside-diphosphate-sugar epimerase n=1 Tax=Colletotrichum graminicola (strain M1.001 / M2 / FGSC 10212) TaxID=645133 RepID=E3QSF9_COLGM|nr:nucleoside-diphosphate-sugar epimerase [Colletotrichum graminicola M1.001]EFQ33786.1 nucleoside-diphosphate-sugar epimerase [Colletotrichum graminicola M1.001]WDK21055.1 nucleoside-diphosphate-sugar epimerase [Colletotrichum graminicola]
MHLILTGATGLVGSGALDAMIKMKDITKISVLSRRPVPMAEDAKDPRVNVIIHKDFEQYDAELLDKLKGANGAVWALGISQNQVSKEAYVKITKDYALAAAKAFADLAPADEPFRFVYVSGEGATQTPGRFSAIFARVKGETETALSEMRAEHPRLRTESIRPCYVDNADHDATKPYVPTPNLTYKVLATVLGTPIRAFAPSYHSPTEALGKFMAEMAMGKVDSGLAAGGKDIVTLNGGLRIVTNGAFRRLAGLA